MAETTRSCTTRCVSMHLQPQVASRMQGIVSAAGASRTSVMLICGMWTPTLKAPLLLAINIPSSLTGLNTLPFAMRPLNLPAVVPTTFKMQIF